MKIKIICTIFFLCLQMFNLFAQTKTKLPFIGSRTYNFTGGSCCDETITIYKNGNCEIVGHGAPGFGDGKTTFYSGVFKNVIWIYEKGTKSYGYKIESRYITQLNKNGKPEIGCKEEKKPCKEELYK